MTDKASTGNLLGFLNQAKRDGDKRPLFQGKITLPGRTDERGFALWPHKSEVSGQTVLSGKLGSAAMSQIERHTDPENLAARNKAITLPVKDGAEPLIIEAGSIILFHNKSKDLENQKRPDYYGYCNPGDGEKLQKVGAWARTDRRGNAMLTGSLQSYVMENEREGMDMAEPDHSALEEQMADDRPKGAKKRTREPEYEPDYDMA